MLECLLNDRVCGADVNLAHVAQRSAVCIVFNELYKVGTTS
jgi:hypothetical protein